MRELPAPASEHPIGEHTELSGVRVSTRNRLALHEHDDPVLLVATLLGDEQESKRGDVDASISYSIFIHIITT